MEEETSIADLSTHDKIQTSLQGHLDDLGYTPKWGIPQSVPCETS